MSEFEPVRGLPAPLPAGESILWQGEPDWRLMVLRTFHVREAALYFAALLLWYNVANHSAGAALIAADIRLGALSVAAICILALIGWLSARATVYTVTDQRLVIRSGIALPLVITVPFTLIENAAIRKFGDGSGDIVLSIRPPARPAYAALWPNARPWHFARPEPMLRSLKQIAEPAQTLARALAAAAGVSPQPMPVDVAQGERGHASAMPQASAAA